ncbi:MAG: YHYH protein [Bacteroidia bacterium]
MKKLFFLLLTFNLHLLTLFAQTPEVTSWILNTTDETGYNNIASNVQSVHYTTTDVYVSATCIPGYDIGPWTGNPNTPANQNFVFKITRTPAENTGTKTATGLGHIGVWSNGVSIFNAKDAFSYNSQGIWNQDALPNEGASFDACLGHPAPNGEYHHHVNPTCLYDDQNSIEHSPIIGYAFDGFPVYGAYAYANTDGSGGIVRMETSYRLRSITDRTTLPDGTVLSAGQYGPAINTTYPLGKYIEDYEYVQGLGHLDEYNGRVCVTPEYPSGTYAYFVSVDEDLVPVYPYTIGKYYYGTVPSGNTGPGGGHNTIPGNATEYVITTGIEDASTTLSMTVAVFPNPTQGIINLSFASGFSAHQLTLNLMDSKGALLMQKEITASNQTLDINNLADGIYFLNLITEEGALYNLKIYKTR